MLREPIVFGCGVGVVGYGYSLVLRVGAQWGSHMSWNLTRKLSVYHPKPKDYKVTTTMRSPSLEASWGRVCLLEEGKQETSHGLDHLCQVRWCIEVLRQTRLLPTM